MFLASFVKALFSHSKRERLSRQALEVLSIVAYKQPIVKSEIDRIRGVNSEGPVFTLLDRKLITIVGRKPAPGRPLLYGTTQEFLAHFGLNDLDDLPRIEELEKILKAKEVPSFAEQIYGGDLSWFFRQWLYGAGVPDLIGHWHYDEKRGRLEIYLRQEGEQLYKIAPEIGIVFSGDEIAQLEQLYFEDREKIFSIPFHEAPERVLFDPLIRLLFKGEFGAR